MEITRTRTQLGFAKMFMFPSKVNVLYVVVFEVRYVPSLSNGNDITIINSISDILANL